MEPQRLIPILLVASLVASSVGAAALTGTSAFDGTNGSPVANDRPATVADDDANGTVTFDIRGDAVANYTVDGERMLTSVQTESAAAYRSRLGAGANADVELSAVADLQGSSVGVAAESETRTEVRAQSGATLAAHNNSNGVLTVESDEDHLVEAKLDDGTSANETSDGRVVVETSDGAAGVFLVAGDGAVTVAEDGDVTARVGENATLAFRAYPEERDAEAEMQERLVANGSAAVEAYATAEDGTESAHSTVTYGQETSANASETAAERVELTVDRATHEGTLVIAHVSEAAVGSLSNLSVTVDGEAAVRAESMAELRQATNDGDTSKYMVRQKADGEATVYVAVNHFSERNVAIEGDDGSAATTTEEPDAETTTDDTTTSADDGTTTSADDTTEERTTTESPDGESDDGTAVTDGTTDAGATDDEDGGSPGFGIGAGLLAVAGLAVLALRRR